MGHDEAEKGRHMTDARDDVVQFSVRREIFDLASSAPDLTDRGMAAFHKQVFGMSFTAGLDSAQQAWQYVELF